MSGLSGPALKIISKKELKIISKLKLFLKGDFVSSLKQS